MRGGHDALCPAPGSAGHSRRQRRRGEQPVGRTAAGPAAAPARRPAALPGRPLQAQPLRTDLTGKAARAAKPRRRISPLHPADPRREDAAGPLRAPVRRTGRRLQAPAAADTQRPQALAPAPGVVPVHGRALPRPGPAAPLPAVPAAAGLAVARQPPAVLDRRIPAVPGRTHRRRLRTHPGRNPAGPVSAIPAAGAEQPLPPHRRRGAAPIQRPRTTGRPGPAAGLGRRGRGAGRLPGRPRRRPPLPGLRPEARGTACTTRHRCARRPRACCWSVSARTGWATSRAAICAPRSMRAASW